MTRFLSSLLLLSVLFGPTAHAMAMAGSHHHHAAPGGAVGDVVDEAGRDHASPAAHGHGPAGETAHQDGPVTECCIEGLCSGSALPGGLVAGCGVSSGSSPAPRLASSDAGPIPSPPLRPPR